MNPRISFSSTDREVVEMAKQFLNSHGIGRYVNVNIRDESEPLRKGKPWKDCHTFLMGGAMDCLITAEKLIEFSLIDRKRAMLEELIVAINSMPAMLWKNRMPEMRRLYWEEGYTQGGLAEHYGTSRGNIGYHMRELGIPTRQRSDLMRKRDEYGRFMKSEAMKKCEK